MPLENFEEEGLAKNPNLELAQWKFMLLSEQYKNDGDIKTKLLDAVKADSTYFNRWNAKYSDKRLVNDQMNDTHI